MSTRYTMQDWQPATVCPRKPFVVQHVNFGTRYEFSSFAAAQEWARGAGFEAAIWTPGGDLAATFSPISGMRRFA